MELIFNDRSVHGQFPELGAFHEAIKRVMAIREVARRFSREIKCHRNLAHAQVTHNSNFMGAVRGLTVPQQQALRQWLTRLGPFWEDAAQHSSAHDLLALGDQVVTGTAVAEAAYCIAHGTSSALISLDPSSWLSSPLLISWYEERHDSQISVPNFWDAGDLRIALESTPMQMRSWADLETTVRGRYPDLTFSENSFSPLEGHPFSRTAALRISKLLDILQSMKNCFDENGQRTSQGHALYQQHFTGDNAGFSDSSDTEKFRYRSNLTFQHPASPEDWLFCTWHGKVRSPQLRVHFSWPIRADEPLYIVYVGPKITKG